MSQSMQRAHDRKLGIQCWFKSNERCVSENRLLRADSIIHHKVLGSGGLSIAPRTSASILSPTASMDIPETSSTVGFTFSSLV
eukprot:m.305024 g.305024  ORF g.305024 m.305024 type:complete len:83 (-) comp16340_c0_seq2:4289-4537(-)